MTSAASSTLIGAGVGAGLMFLLDPSRGARRRALVRDKFVRAAYKTRDAAGATSRDLSNRLTGLAARTQSRLADEPADDSVVVERVRAKLGRVASHPRAIDVLANDGIITLRGDVLVSEVPWIIGCVGDVAGVRQVRNEMTAHPRANGVPSLQGKSERPGWWSTWLREGWSPTAMLATGVGAAAIAVAIARR